MGFFEGAATSISISGGPLFVATGVRVALVLAMIWFDLIPEIADWFSYMCYCCCLETSRLHTLQAELFDSFLQVKYRVIDV